MLVATLYSKSARIILGVLCLLFAGQIVRAYPRSATADNTQSKSFQTGASKLPTKKQPGSNVPVEVASATTLKQVSCEPQLVDQLAAEIVQAFQLDNLITAQRAANLRPPSNDSSVIVSDSSGRSPPRQT
jgi:hypothetical protein